MVKHTQAIHRQIAGELFVFDHFEGLAFKKLKEWIFEWIEFHEIR